ncbi:glucuronate isomerase [Flagellimonas taeanensis]|uniref:glucuronate isomerase n=1 Tax=Flavobacteriaceae TaxID=49546 RepID=UPI000E68C625|nr:MULTISPECIES: glucuronate isomerase [Allomuricauda]MDC6386739.1 glucuronate isomerase [Muricauda sp. SK9]RIV49961.1 glucuronate isomerase [Allomuricauda taeanensis]
MKNFIHDDFLLETDHAKELYHDYAKNQPIIDYHSHLPPKELAGNRMFENMTQLWIDGDHYKWRAMRALGIPEKYITGEAPDSEKFNKWAETVPYALRNPLYHWTHLELSRYFGIGDLLTPKTAGKIYEECNAKLGLEDYSARGLIHRMNVEVVCTTDDPLDSLDHHKDLAGSGWPVKVLPTFRPDGLITIEGAAFIDYLSSLSKITNIKITDFKTLGQAIKKRVEYFHKNGCRLSDHGLPHAYAMDFTEVEINNIVSDRLRGGTISKKEVAQYKSAVLGLLGGLYTEKNWTMQLHLGPIRNTNEVILSKVGFNAGVDSIGDFQQAEQLAGLLNGLNNKGHLPKTVLYNSNPNDNELFATMAGNFNGDGIKGKVQFGAAWWFLDQMDGITNQLNALSNMGLLSCSVGMLTDSRSFLSFPRHEYYRRILCNLLGKDIKAGLLPNDMEWIGKIVRDITYNNAKDFFQFPSYVEKAPLENG